MAQPKFRASSFFTKAALVVFTALYHVSVQGQTLNTMYSFTGGSDGGGMVGNVIQAGNGILYGMATFGGTNGNGTIFKITTNGTFSLLYTFVGASDGMDPYGNLVQASDGNLYGMANQGGANGDGTIFKITTSGAFSLLYQFTNGSDGAYPYGSLIQASDGNLYGMANAGGSHSDGTIFKITTGGTFSLLHAFTGGSGGGFPYGSLVQASDGNLYGLSNIGGTNGSAGAIFKMTLGGTFTVLHSFAAATDGEYPYGSLIQAADGGLYGLAANGGTANGGSIFKMTTNGTFSVLHLFVAATDGEYPEGNLVQANDGTLYGLAPNGGAHSDGTVFKTTTNGTFTPLYSFAGSSDGGSPFGSFIQGADGVLYSATSAAGAHSEGTIFKFPGAPPQITQNPTNQSAQCGSNVLFSVTAIRATGYQWYKGASALANGGSISGSGSAILTLADVSIASSGSYSVVVTNPSVAVTSSVANLTVVDTIPPVMTLNGPATTNIECTSTFADPGAGANDSCAGSLAVTTIGSVNVNAKGSYALSYVATDPSGNSVTNTRTVVVQDTTPPLVTLIGAATTNIECSASFADPGAAANDACAGSLSPTSSGNFNPNAIGAYLITYSATDPSGNTGTATRTVIVQDTTPPVITLIGASTTNVECASIFTDPGSTANDACAGSESIASSDTVNTGTLGAYLLTYITSDASGNSATNIRAVNVVDTTPPVITLIGASTTNIECASTFADPGATANDACAGSQTVTMAGSVNANLVGTYLLTYTSSDPSGNSATNFRTVNVVDTTPPVVTLAGTNAMTVECHTGFTDPGATANDVCAGSQSVTTTGNVDANTVGIYVLTYTATDPSGNTASATLSVAVTDTTPPIVALAGTNIMTAECHTSFNDPGASANDSCAGSLPVTTSGNLDTNTIGTYLLTYTATDPSGNAASVTRTVNVTDTTAPVITLGGNSTTNVEYYETFTDPGATANDTCAGNLAVTTTGSVDTTTLGTYILTYTATEPSSNSASATLTVNVMPAPLTVTANDAARVFSAPDPVFTASYSGFANSENSSVISGSPDFSTTATNTSPPGTYSITPSLGTLSATNYTFNTFDDGTLTIAAASSTNVLASSPNPSGLTSNVTFTATISAVSPATAIPTGNVVFLANGVPFSTNDLVAGVATASTTLLPFGIDTVTAAYAGDGDFLGSTNSMSQEVDIYPTCSQTNYVLGISGNPDGTLTLSFQGTPQAQYYIIAGANEFDPISTWVPLPGSTNTVSTVNGVWTYTATNAAMQQYYISVAVDPCP